MAHLILNMILFIFLIISVQNLCSFSEGTNRTSDIGWIDVPSVKEPAGQARSDGKRPDNLTPV